VGARFLDHEARAAFKQAIEAIENASSVEIVVAVRRRSSGYFHANLIFGGIVTFAALAAMLFLDQAFGLVSILVDPFLVGALAAAAVELLPGVKRLLTPSSVRRREVRNAARAAFVERGVHNTMDRSGILVYVSWLEQQIALVADSGVLNAFTVEAVEAAERDINDSMSNGGVAVARTLESYKTRLGVVLPRRAEDINELPDAIDDDMGDD
jgi:putative membrane protein